MSSKWRNDMKNMSKEEFHSKYDLNMGKSGGAFIPKSENNHKSSKGDDVYHPSNRSYDDFSNLAYEGSSDDL